MIDKKFYRSLLVLVNNKDVMDHINTYVEARIVVLRDQLETTKGHERLLEIKGSLSELRRFKTLRDEVIKGAE